MAIMANGKIVAKGEPAKLTAALEGMIWRKSVAKNEVESYKASYDVISSRLYAGQTVLHAVGESCPGEGFESVAPSLEDVYFHTLMSSPAPQNHETPASNPEA